MKASVALLFGLTTAAAPPEITFNITRIEETGRAWEQWSRENKRMKRAADREAGRNIMRTGAQLETDAYINYGEIMKPYQQAWIRELDAWSVPETCNAVAAQRCVYAAYCVEPAHCTHNE